MENDDKHDKILTMLEESNKNHEKIMKKLNEIISILGENIKKS